MNGLNKSVSLFEETNRGGHAMADQGDYKVLLQVGERLVELALGDFLHVGAQFFIVALFLEVIPHILVAHSLLVDLVSECALQMC